MKNSISLIKSSVESFTNRVYQVEDKIQLLKKKLKKRQHLREPNEYHYRSLIAQSKTRPQFWFTGPEQAVLRKTNTQGQPNSSHPTALFSIKIFFLTVLLRS